MKKLADFVNRACSSLAWEAGIIGGVAATVGGGKFMTGFMTGAFTHALNWQKHEARQYGSPWDMMCRR